MGVVVVGVVNCTSMCVVSGRELLQVGVSFVG